MSNYYELRSQAARIVPRTPKLYKSERSTDAVREKGRKANYRELKLSTGQWTDQSRLLNTEEVNSFVEVSCRAAACPMPLNVDVYDALRCPYNCRYCFANSFRASLYTAFFDNSKTMGLRHCNPDYYKREFDKLMRFRGKDPHSIKSDVAKAVAMGIPMRFGIRFEDFLPAERKHGVSLQLLNYLADCEYPLMINTKSDLVAADEYLDALSRNKGKTAVHVTLIAANNRLLKSLEPGAPSYDRRIKAMGRLVEAGVRVVARIEPFLVFLSDVPEEVERYQTDLKSIGVKNITFDTYSYTGRDPGIRQSFRNMGLDWDRLFWLGCDSQPIGSLLLGEFMKLWRDKGFKCSTFDMGNVPDNDQDVCCEVGDWFGGGFNYGSTVMAARFIQSKKGESVSWSDFREWTYNKGGFLSDVLELEVHQLWNYEGSNEAYSHLWSRGIRPAGSDEHGYRWRWVGGDYRKSQLEALK